MTSVWLASTLLLVSALPTAACPPACYACNKRPLATVGCRGSACVRLLTSILTSVSIDRTSRGWVEEQGPAFCSVCRRSASEYSKDRSQQRPRATHSAGTPDACGGPAGAQLAPREPEHTACSRHACQRMDNRTEDATALSSQVVIRLPACTKTIYRFRRQDTPPASSRTARNKHKPHCKCSIHTVRCATRHKQEMKTTSQYLDFCSGCAHAHDAGQTVSPQPAS